jgi:hypothetical protein
MRLRIDYDGDPNGLRRELRNAFRLRERDVAEPEPVVQRVTIRVTDQLSPARSTRRGNDKD